MTNTAATVTVRCNDPSHARGKIAVIAVFVRDESGIWRDRREKTRTRPFHSRSDTPALFKCNLCRRELPPWVGRVAIFAVLDRLADQGCVGVTFAEFVDLASKVERSSES